MADVLITGTTLVEKESRSIGDVPIGGIVSWAKTLAGVPNLAEGWVECDGSVLVDALSPLNGQTIPDLNGDNRFMRGNATSGGTGGATTSSTNLKSNGTIGYSDDSGESVASGAGGDLITRGSTGGSTITLRDKSTDSFSILPPYYNVVWIIRVR